MDWRHSHWTTRLLRYIFVNVFGPKDNMGVIQMINGHQIGFGHVSKYIWTRKIVHPNHGDKMSKWWQTKLDKRAVKKLQFAVASTYSPHCARASDMKRGKCALHVLAPINLVFDHRDHRISQWWHEDCGKMKAPVHLMMYEVSIESIKDYAWNM